LASRDIGRGRVSGTRNLFTILTIVGLSTILILSLATAWYFWVFLPQQAGAEVPTGGGVETGNPYYGRLKIYSEFYWSYDKSTIYGGAITYKVYHKDKVNLAASFTDASPNATVTVWDSDDGLLYLVADYGTGTTNVLDIDAIQQQAFVKPGSYQGWDYDLDGTVEPCFQIDITSLPALSAGLTAHEIDVNMFAWKYASGLTITNIANITSVSTTALTDYYSENYFSGISEGYAFKIVKMEITFADISDATQKAANDTYAENGNIKLREVTCSWGTYSGSQITWELSNHRWVINVGVPDINNEQGAILLQRRRGDPATTLTVKIHWQCKFAAASKTLNPTLKITYIDPASTTGTYTQVLSLAS